MRDKILRVCVGDENYKIASKNGCKEISYINKSDNLVIKKGDFVVICDEAGNEVLRNIWELSDKKLYYTTCLNEYTPDFSLSVICTNLYDSN